MDVTPDGLGKTVNDYGYAVVFLFMYLITVWFLIRLLVSQIKDRTEETKQMTVVVERNTTSNNELIVAMRDMKRSVEEHTKQEAELLGWLRANGAGGRLP